MIATRGIHRRWPAMKFMIRKLSGIVPRVPIVNLSDEIQASKDLHHAFSNFGCCYLKGHGIDINQEKRVINAAHSYFDLPKHVKEANQQPSTDGFVRGYLGIGAESGSDDLFEVKEAFSYGYEWDSTIPPTNPLQGPNIWPAEFNPSHKLDLQTFFDDIVNVSDKVCRTLSIALGKPPSYLSSFCDKGDTISIMRSFHYFPYSVMKDGIRDYIGSSPHTDWGFLTLILQDEIGGLQLYHQGEWHDVPHIPGTIFVNGGDYLSLLTQGTWISPIHRVVNDESRNRLSMVFFYYPNYDANIPISSRPTAQGLSKYNTLLDGHKNAADTSFGAYISSKWANVQRPE